MKHLKLFESENITIKNFADIMSEKFFSNFTLENWGIVPGDISINLIFKFSTLTEPSYIKILELLNYLKDFLVVEMFYTKAEKGYIVVNYQLNSESLFDYLETVKYNL